MKRAVPAGLRRLACDESGVAIVELALTLPLLLIFIMGCIQFAILYETYLSVMNTARDAGRWLAVHPHTLDSTTTSTINARLPSNLSAARLTTTYNPTCTAFDANGRCAGRPVDSQVQISFSYDASNVVFLPANFQLFGLAITFPTMLPTYTIYMKVEPS